MTKKKKIDTTTNKKKKTKNASSSSSSSSSSSPPPMMGSEFEQAGVIMNEAIRGRMSDFQAKSTAEAMSMMDDMRTLPLSSQRSIIRNRLVQLGTNCDLNDSDMMGDGDQTPIPTVEGRQTARDLFATGGDIERHMLLPGSMSSLFPMFCISGAVRAVKEQLERTADKNRPSCQTPALLRLLERRETSMRLSPLLLTVACGKNVTFADDSNRGGKNTQTDPSMDHVGVVKLLLRYGARPDAKDVVGKTVCHYGSEQMATEMTLEAVDMCIRAARTSRLFGKEVELYGLSNESLNGCRGVVGGFLAENDRREVFLLDQKKEVAVKPEHIRLIQQESANGKGNAIAEEDTQEPPMLADIQDRMGTVCLHEVIMSQRVDVAKFLLEKHGASIDPVDMEGVSPRSMCMTPGGLAASSVNPLIMRMAISQGRAERKERRKRCDYCSKLESDLGMFKKCSKCKSVQYCGRECQVAAWQAGHREICGESTKGIKLDPPLETWHAITISQATGKTTLGGSYRKPEKVGFNETFYIKVQAGLSMGKLLAYDKTRQCFFRISPGQPGYDQLYERVRQEKATGGRKSYFKASFDEKGTCTVFPGTATLKQW